MWDCYDRPYRRRKRARARYRPEQRGVEHRYDRAYGRRGEYVEPDPYSPYGREFFRWATPVPGHGIYPDHHWGGGMIHGLEGAGWAPFGLIGFPEYAYEYRARRRPRPEESPTYGRDADRALRAWARRHGYELGPPIRPTGGARRRPRPRRGAGRRRRERRWFRGRRSGRRR